MRDHFPVSGLSGSDGETQASERILTVTAEESIQLYDFLRVRVGLTRRQISQLKYREQGIRVNGERRYVTWQLVPGDRVAVALEGVPLDPKPIVLNPSPIEVLYEDEDLIAVNKPAGVATHPAGMHQDDTLVNMLMYYFHQKGESLRVRPAGRLDLTTSGVILFSKNQAAAGRLVKQRERKQLRKEYIAAVTGRVTQEEGDITLPIRRDPENVCRVIISPEGKNAHTHYRVLAADEKGRWSLLRLVLATGRMHQIRVHMSAIGHPLLGDRMYGGSTEFIERAALHAAAMTFLQPFTGAPLTVEAPLPPDMRSFAAGGSPAGPGRSGVKEMPEIY